MPKTDERRWGDLTPEEKQDRLAHVAATLATLRGTASEHRRGRHVDFAFASCDLCGEERRALIASLGL